MFTQLLFWESITDAGNNGLLAVLTVAAAAYLAWGGARKAALVLIASLVVTAASIAALKIIFLGCSVYSPPWMLSPSGHTALAAAVWGTLAVIIACALEGWCRAIPLMMAAAISAAVAYSRVYLEFHTIKEICLGLALGTLVAASAYAILQRAPPPPIKLKHLMIVLIIAGAASYSVHIPVEEGLRQLMEILKLDSSFCKALMVI
jgi:membrane-associated phospholipid phosphatase